MAAPEPNAHHELDNGSPISKLQSQHIEDLQNSQTHATYIEKGELGLLSVEHRDYLLGRHGTLELDPVPAFGDADPYNWANWKVTITSKQ
jgi:hypothetical protein